MEARSPSSAATLPQMPKAARPSPTPSSPSAATAGWTTKSLSAPTPLGSGAYFGEDRSTVGLSSDLAQSVLWSNQPLAGGSSPAGTNLYLRRADGTMVALTKAGAPKFSAGGELSGASLDFSRLFIVSTVKQLPADPVNGGNTYEWADGNLKLVTLPARRDAGAEWRVPARRRPAGGLRRRHPGPLQGGRPPGSLPARQRPGNQERLRLQVRTVPDATTPRGIGRHRRRRLARCSSPATPS